MRNWTILVLFFPVFLNGQDIKSNEIKRYQEEASKVNIIRDRWGIPHIYGKTDADAVFGLLYAECEENFEKVEQNYLNVLGRNSEIKGQSSLYDDLLIRLIEDSTAAIQDYKNAPENFKKLLNAFADGINYYLYLNPGVKPKVLSHFEPWYPLMFTDGSVGAIMTGGIRVGELKDFYDKSSISQGEYQGPLSEISETGSNGFTISPSLSANGKALLYINPHVPFYFRMEVDMNSEEGLHAYGAVTWGQFFIYQGFNEHCGWMHTSSYADVADIYKETIKKNGKKFFYRYENQWIPLLTKKQKIAYKSPEGIKIGVFQVYYTGHGPILASRNGKWLSLKAVNQSYTALLESWKITKARNLEEYKKAMELLSNISNNTLYADDQGNTAFWYGNFMPKRDPRYDWTQPVNGETKLTEWKGLHPLSEIVQVINPASGYIQNCNATPFTCSGFSSPLKENYPVYMAPDGQNYRGLNAMRLFKNARNFTIDSLIQIGYNRYLSAFDDMIPDLLNAYDSNQDTSYFEIEDAVETLRNWDRISSARSEETSLAITWASALIQDFLPKPESDEQSTYFTLRLQKMMKSIPPKTLLEYLKNTCHKLEGEYSTWQIPWGNINRYQRPDDGISFNDTLPFLPSGLASSQFGELASFQSRTFNTDYRYGYSGNSFIAAVEFGDKIRAKSLITGGQSFNPKSPHFTDQAEMFLNGHFKNVLFYKEDVLKNIERQYHPGE